MTARKAKKGARKRAIPSRKFARRKPGWVDDAAKIVRVVQEHMPQTAQVLAVAGQSAARAVGQAAIDELSKADGQLAAQLIELLAKKRNR